MPPVRTFRVMGAARSYDHVCALRAVTSVDGVTAESYPFDHTALDRVATRFINEIRGIDRAAAAGHDRVGVSGSMAISR